MNEEEKRKFQQLSDNVDVLTKKANQAGFDLLTYTTFIWSFIVVISIILHYSLLGFVVEEIPAEISQTNLTTSAFREKVSISFETRNVYIYLSFATTSCQVAVICTFLLLWYCKAVYVNKGCCHRTVWNHQNRYILVYITSLILFGLTIIFDSLVFYNANGESKLDQRILLIILISLDVSTLVLTILNILIVANGCCPCRQWFIDKWANADCCLCFAVTG